MRFGLKEEIVRNIISVLNSCPSVQKAVIFGSRARGDYRYNSDIDVAIYLDADPYPGFFTDFDEAAGIYKTNIIDMRFVKDEKFRASIERDGVEIYQRSY